MHCPVCRRAELNFVGLTSRPDFYRLELRCPNCWQTQKIVKQDRTPPRVKAVVGRQLTLEMQ